MTTRSETVYLQISVAQTRVNCKGTKELRHVGKEQALKISQLLQLYPSPWWRIQKLSELTQTTLKHAAIRTHNNGNESNEVEKQQETTEKNNV